MTARRDPFRPPWGLASRLATGQLLSWGALYYSHAVIASRMRAETGWSQTFLNTGLSLGLLAWGLGSPPAGSWMQRNGERSLLTGASLTGGCALLLLASTSHPAVYLAGWILLGTAMAGALYEPAFAVIVRHFGAEHRRGIMLVTLVGGFAGTVFIPLCQLMMDHFGWRVTLASLGLLQIGVLAPLYATGIPKLSPVSPAEPGAGFRPAFGLGALRRDVADPGFAGLAAAFTSHALASSGLIFLLLPLLQSAGVSASGALMPIALIGPAQVLGRLLLGTVARHCPGIRAGLWALGGLAAAALVMLMRPPTPFWLALFAALFGISNGMMTIIRGTAVVEVFGPGRYAEQNGALSLPVMVARAASPLLLAGIWSRGGSHHMVFGTILLLTLAGGGSLLLVPRAKAGAAAPTQPA